MDMNCAYCAKGELVAKFGYEVRYIFLRSSPIRAVASWPANIMFRKCSSSPKKTEPLLLRMS